MSTLQGGPLSGLRVIEFGQIAAGPFTGMLLADLGADVVKVERPDSGDGMRDWPPFFVNEQGESYSANFASLNRNKRSITVDFKDPEQLEALRKLCGKADIIIENYRPGCCGSLAWVTMRCRRKIPDWSIALSPDTAKRARMRRRALLT